MSDCMHVRKDSKISFNMVSDNGLSEVGKSAMGSFVCEGTAALVILGPLTSIPGSACSRTGKSMCSFDFTVLLVDGLEAPDDDLLCVLALVDDLQDPHG